MKVTRSWPSRWLTKLLGCVVLASSLGCATVTVSPEPYRCPPLTNDILDEYQGLMTLDEHLVEDGDTPLSMKLRAWVREADKACRANLQLLKEN